MDLTKLQTSVRELTGKDYEQLTDGQKVDVFQQISKITYKTIITDLLKKVQTLGWDNFLVEPTRFGNGYRILTSGLGQVENYSTNPTDRFPQTRRLLKDYEDLITDKAQLRYRETLNEAETAFYFKNLENMNTYLEQLRKRITDSFDMLFKDTMLRLFGNSAWVLRTGTDASNYLTLVDKVKNQMTNNISINGKTVAEQVKFIINFVKMVTTLTVDCFNIGDNYTTPNADYNPVFNNVALDDLVLIMSQQDYTEFSTQTQASLYHKELFKLPDIRIESLPIPSGTYYLIDKNAIQISPNRNLQLAEFYPNTLDTDLIHHMWFYMGVYKRAFGVKINFVSDNSGKDANKLLTEIQQRYVKPTGVTGKSK